METTTEQTAEFKWRCNTPGLLKEMIESNHSMAIFFQPIKIFKGLLTQVADRAIELNDPKLNCLMIRLCLYEGCTDHTSKEFHQMMEYLKKNDK